ncbi:hypothetical protein R69746_08439 [Paraburkholderia aspalathi]|nr:hypothetical protein R69746_08439 [Paraburkholderia aspalathi]
MSARFAPRSPVRRKHTVLQREIPDYYAMRRFYRDGGGAFCAECLRETGSFKALWALRAVTACHTHGVWLSEACPSCKNAIEWDRCGACVCTCGADLSHADSTRAPDDVLIFTRALVARLEGHAEADFIIGQSFCSEVVHISASEWLALCNFFASTSDLSDAPVARGPVQYLRERESISIAARVLLTWRTKAFEEINSCWRTLKPTDDSAPFLPLRQLRARQPHLYAARLSNPLSLPVFFTKALSHHISALTVHSCDIGLAINPCVVAWSETGEPGLRVNNSEQASALGVEDLSARDEPSFASVLDRLRHSPPRLYSYAEAEHLIGATRHQRRILMRTKRLRRMMGCRAVISSELERFRRWLREIASPRKPPTALIPLSRISPQSGRTLESVLNAISERRIEVFCAEGRSISLDTCSVLENSITVSVGE